MGTILTLKKPLETLLDISPLSDLVLAQTQELEKIKLAYGRETVLITELFTVTPSIEEGLTLKGELRLCINAGAGMRQGKMTIVSSVGASAGESMTGGELIVQGSVGKNACREMQNGFVRIFGDAESGLARGMRRGMIVVCGRARGEACAEMRGGTVLLLNGTDEPEQLERGLSRGTVICPKARAFQAVFTRGEPRLNLFAAAFSGTRTARRKTSALLARRSVYAVSRDAAGLGRARSSCFRRNAQ